MKNDFTDQTAEGVAVLALTGYVLIIANDEEAVFDSLFSSDV